MRLSSMHLRRYRVRVFAVATAALSTALGGCGNDDSSPPPPLTATVSSTSTPTSTPTVRPTSTATAEPTVTPTTAPDHDEVVLGSSEDGGGSVLVEAPEDVDDASFADCLGGEGDDCTGGLAIFTASHPGFEPVSEVEGDLFPIAHGTTILLEIVSIANGMTISHDGEQIDAPGETLPLGTLPVEDHFHINYTIAIPGGEPLDVRAVTLKIRTDGEQYQPSEPFTLQFQPTRGNHE